MRNFVTKFENYQGMQEQQRTYIAIDLKSFYASVECVDRGLDPLTTNLVVADESRTDKTICLAVSPSRSWAASRCSSAAPSAWPSVPSA